MTNSYQRTTTGGIKYDRLWKGELEKAAGHYILHKFLAYRTDLLAERCGKHHDLLIMRSHFEDLLNVSPHVCIIHIFVNDTIIRKKDTSYILYNNYYLKHVGNRKLPSDSSILSHSSRIKCLTFFNERSLSLARASILPGVPTTI